jgi:hypothetical protein
MSVSCECCVLSGKGLCLGLITRQEKSYRMCDVSECDREASTMGGPSPLGAVAPRREKFSPSISSIVHFTDEKQEKNVKFGLLVVLSYSKFVGACPVRSSAT